MSDRPDLRGKTVLITGASAGIGLEASAEIAAMGAEVVMVARDRTRGETALAEVRRRSGSGALSLHLCDFSSQPQIRALAAEVRAAHPRLHLLVNNAGGVSSDRRETPDGIEQTFAVNHLGPFLLTNLLLEVLVQSAPARIVNVASTGHYRATLDFDNLGYEKGGYFIMRAYARSKLANVIFTRDLARRLAGTGVTVTSLHPGAVATEIWAGAPTWARPALAIAKHLFMISPAEGASRIVYLATSPEVEGKSGGYYEKNVERAPAKLAQDEAVAKRLWDASVRLTGLAAL
ncbi:MAG TPA: SDR family oxidoreductase [Polyangiaceae bacterium]|nr:SDR family oxidoreductase [Polyangiaceae bacterium]